MKGKEAVHDLSWQVSQPWACMLWWLQVSVSGQGLVFVVRHQGWSPLQRAGLATYVAFISAQVRTCFLSHRVVMLSIAVCAPPQRHCVQLCISQDWSRILL